MAIRDALFPEFDHEMAVSRRVLERLPEDKLGWRPDPRSMTLGRLASHIAETPGWLTAIAEQDSLDFAPPGKEPGKAFDGASKAEILETFDRNVAAGRKALETIDDAAMFRPWSLLKGGEAVFTMPRIAVIRGMILSHQIHHRGQFSVYLRLNGAPVPSIYGPSADEPA